MQPLPTQLENTIKQSSSCTLTPFPSSCTLTPFPQKKLRINKILKDTCPGIPLPRNKEILDVLNEGFDAPNQLKAIHKGMNDGGISGILQSRIPVETFMEPQDVIDELRKVYFERAELRNLWAPARDWLRDLQQHEFLDASLVIPN